ncbi:unnamed protein product [Periconia digitata]|uniref:Pinin/SDK/MemA protein domain-containing protein n=1 Tax=Periconia digitata TaxID=1303443 RepID=A0A9W4UN86_9PLEO|nr:unnamed protein product [Periconia digitata]
MMDAIASAVVLPNPGQSSPPTASSPNGAKRRQSSVSEQAAKRARLNDDNSAAKRRDSASNTSATTSTPTTTGRERGRERRLFGAALGVLSQNNSTTAGQKRRSEIERRQHAQRKSEDEESEQKRAERLAERRAQRWKEQRYFDQASMQLRHDNLLAMAHFLKTRSEPQLHYKPREPTIQENNRIKGQIARARDIIREELEQRGRDQNAERSRTLVHAEGTAEADRTNRNMHSAPFPTHSEHHNNILSGPPGKMSIEKAADVRYEKREAIVDPSRVEANNRETVDETGEEVVEAAEDTVIY